MIKISNVAAIRKFFAEGENGRKVEMAELKALTPKEREELGKLAKVELAK